MAKKFVIWDDATLELGAASSFRRQWIRDLFSSPFWENIPDRPTPYSYDIPSSSYTVDAGAETTLLSKSGEGFVNILYHGDGSADLSIRVYVDGSLDDEFSCNETRVGAYAFTSSIEVKLYNPGTSSVTGNCPTSNVRGWVR